MSAGQLPPPGTVLRKVDRNGAVRCEAVVAENGQVVYRGVAYPSISAAAKVAAGDIGLAARSCDGYAFFGLKNRDQSPRPARGIDYAANAILPLPLPSRWDDLPSAAVVDHGEHGRPDESGAPRNPDCACRCGPLEEACAEAGCGFCRAARMAKDRAESVPAATVETGDAPALVGEATCCYGMIREGNQHDDDCAFAPLAQLAAPVADLVPAIDDQVLVETAQVDAAVSDAYRETASRGASSASTQDEIAEEATAPLDVSEMRAELLQEIDDVIQGTSYWQGGRLVTIKHLLARVERAEAEAAMRVGEWCAESRTEGRGPCGACAWCCRQANERAERAETALAAIAECPYWIDKASVPAAGIDAAPEQVVGTMAVSLTKVRQVRAVLAAVASTGREQALEVSPAPSAASPEGCQDAGAVGATGMVDPSSSGGQP